MLRSAGVTGEITNDAKNPVTGVYLNEMQASKMDWYIQRKSTVKRTGDNTYHVTYSFTNTLQPGEAGSLPEYITANAKGGVAVNRVVIYTPAGGEVSNVSASNGSSFAQVQAKDHMTYMGDISLAPQDTVTIEYDVTTAAGSAHGTIVTTAPHRGRSTRGMLFCFNVCSTGSAVFFRSVG